MLFHKFVGVFITNLCICLRLWSICSKSGKYPEDFSSFFWYLYINSANTLRCSTFSRHRGTYTVNNCSLLMESYDEEQWRGGIVVDSLQVPLSLDPDAWDDTEILEVLNNLLL